MINKEAARGSKDLDSRVNATELTVRSSTYSVTSYLEKDFLPYAIYIKFNQTNTVVYYLSTQALINKQGLPSTYRVRAYLINRSINQPTPSSLGTPTNTIVHTSITPTQIHQVFKTSFTSDQQSTINQPIYLPNSKSSIITRSEYDN
ncbi:hypothetical protein EYC84_010479 [Monilinia fructicola]|uniref:Uncharacterized protein n=1 Tax=Monilinia fructicola TaxID=38448 RepID=A0A5M9JK82_MONFR|nr:hypothetical protein EYC84_010479 [Monilinia fructicola]